MTTLTVYINNKKSEKAVVAVLDALSLNYNIEFDPSTENRRLNKNEQRIYENLKDSLAQIKLHQEGKIELPDARELLDEF